MISKEFSTKGFLEAEDRRLMMYLILFVIIKAIIWSSEIIISDYFSLIRFLQNNILI